MCWYAQRCPRHSAESNCKTGTDWNMHNGMIVLCNISVYFKAVLKFTASAIY